MSPAIGQQLKILATEHLLQDLGRHSDFAAASHLAGPREEAVKFIVDAGDRLVPACQNADATKSTKIVHDLFLPSEKRGYACASASRAASSSPELIWRTWRAQLRTEDGGRVQHHCRTLIGEKKKPKVLWIATARPSRKYGASCMRMTTPSCATENRWRIPNVARSVTRGVWRAWCRALKIDPMATVTLGNQIRAREIFGMACPNSPCRPYRRPTSTVRPSSLTFRQPSPRW